MNTGEVIALAKAFGGGGGSSGGGVLVVHQDENGVLDKTWQEIHDAVLSVLVINQGYAVFICHCMFISGHAPVWLVTYANIDQEGTVSASNYIANSADGYPAYSE